MAGLKYWVWLSEVKGLTNRSKLLLLDYFGTPENIYYADEDEYRLVEGIEPRQIALLAKSGVPLYGTALRDDTVPLAEADLARAAVAIGSEGRGLSEQVLGACEKTLKIPMNPRCESLNAAIAATVVLWEMYR